MHVSAIWTPLITFLLKLIHIDHLEIFLQIFSEIFFDNFLQILTQKMSLFWQFSPKITYFDQIGSVNHIFLEISSWQFGVFSHKFPYTLLLEK